MTREAQHKVALQCLLQILLCIFICVYALHILLKNISELLACVYCSNTVLVMVSFHVF